MWCSFQCFGIWCQLFSLVTSWMSLACSWTHVDSLDDVCNSFHSCHGFAVQLVDSLSLLCFGMVLQRVVLVLNVVVTFVELRYEDDPMMELPRGHEKDGNAIWNIPAAEDHNMFVCCMFLEIGWSCLELELDLNSSWIFCLGVLVPVFVSPCTFLWACAVWFLVCLSFLFCALLFGLHELLVQQLECEA